MPIQAILFDADGVLILRGGFGAYLDRELHVSRADLMEFFGGEFQQCLVGRADLKQIIVPFLVRWGWKRSVDDFLQVWFDEENVVDERMLRAVAELRGRGYLCGLATNQEKYRTEYIKTRMGFSARFDTVFSAADLGVMKNDPRFFELATRSLGLPKEAILFWDDSLPNVEVARAYGWNAEQYVDFESFQKVLPGYLGRSLEDLDGQHDTRL